MLDQHFLSIKGSQFFSLMWRLVCVCVCWMMHGESALLRWCREVNYSRHYKDSTASVRSLTGCFIYILKPLNHISFWNQGSKSHLQGQVDVVMFYNQPVVETSEEKPWWSCTGTAMLVFWEYSLMCWLSKTRKNQTLLKGWYTWSCFSCMWCGDLLLTLCHSSGPVVSAALKIHHHVWAVSQLQFQLQRGACVCLLFHSLELMAFCWVLLGCCESFQFCFISWNWLYYVNSVYLLSMFLGLYIFIGCYFGFKV